MKTIKIYLLGVICIYVLQLFFASCKKETIQSSNNNLQAQINMSSNTQRPFVGLIEVLEDNTNSISTIVTNSGYHTIYSLSVNVQSGDILRIRGQVEMTNDNVGQSGSITVRGNIKTLINGLTTGSYSSQNDVSDPYSPYAHHMHHMPLWTDALYTVTQSGVTKVEVQYAVTKSSSSPTVKIEPFNSSTPYGHLVIEHYRTFPTRKEAKNSLALGLDTVLSDKNEKAKTFLYPTTVYSIQCNVESGDIIRLLAQATSTYIDKKAFHGQRILRNGSGISPFSTENNISRIPNLPLWTDAVDKPATNASNDYTVNLHSLIDPEFGSASIADAGYFYCLQFKKLNNNRNAKQLAEIKIINGSQSDYSLVANSGWHNIISYSGQANKGDIIKATGFSEFYIPNTYQYGINCQYRIKINGEIVQSGKYITEFLEVLPLRAEIFKTIDTSGTYTIDVEVSCTRYDANPTIKVLGGQSGVLLERFSVN